MSAFNFFVFNKKKSITTHVWADTPEEALKQTAHLFDKRSKPAAISVAYTINRPTFVESMAKNIEANNLLLQKLKGMKF
jgi:hypothetical protein